MSTKGGGQKCPKIYPYGLWMAPYKNNIFTNLKPSFARLFTILGDYKQSYLDLYSITVSIHFGKTLYVRDKFAWSVLYYCPHDMLFWLKSVYSFWTGSPWDWQSMNAKYPSDDTGISRSISKSSYRSAEANFPKIQPVNANISVFEGHTALLPCRIKHLKEYTVRSRTPIVFISR